MQLMKQLECRARDLVVAPSDVGKEKEGSSCWTDGAFARLVQRIGKAVEAKDGKKVKWMEGQLAKNRSRNGGGAREPAG